MHISLARQYFELYVPWLLVNLLLRQVFLVQRLATPSTRHGLRNFPRLTLSALYDHSTVFVFFEILIDLHYLLIQVVASLAKHPYVNSDKLARNRARF